MTSGARLSARPDPGAELTLPLGRAPLGFGERRDGLLLVPQATTAGPVPLVVLLHGAGSSAAAGMAVLGDLAEEHAVVALATDARASTWDVVRGGFGPDVAFLDRALAHLFAGCPIDAGRVALAGFSDGASYALSLGLGNGDLFTHVLAFSPGFAAPPEPVGRPRCFVTHGVDDPVLPIERCSRRIVPVLREHGYEVEYTEFDGGHAVPPQLARAALDWVDAEAG